MTWHTNTTTIGRVRVQGATTDPFLTQQRVERMLNSIEMRPPRLPPSAILYVRKLSDPLPHALDIQDRQVSAAHVWEQAVVEALNELTARAARPLLGSVPSNMEAVVFADRAELLACLAWDWRRGQLSNHWWWQQLLRVADVRSAVIATWQNAPEYIPAALSHMRTVGEDVPFVASLTEREAQHLTQAVCMRFTLQPLHLTFEEEVSLASGIPALRHASMLMPHAPWANHVEETALGLPPAQQLLLGVSLMLVHQPDTVRTGTWTHRVRQWYHARKTTNIGQNQRPARAADHQLPVPTPDRPPMRQSSNDQPVIEAETGIALRRTHADTWIDATSVSMTQHETTETTPSIPDAADRPLEQAHMSEGEASPETVTAITDELEFETEYAGLFYLINVGLHLNLYGDFTTPGAAGMALPIWDFLALLGEQFAGPHLRNDPVWALLAQSSRRSDTLPGELFDAPSIWRISPHWLVVLPEAEIWHWAVESERLRVWHPAGFWVIDVPLQTDVFTQLVQEIEPFGAVTLQLGQMPVPRSVPLDRWLDWIVAYIRTRLAQALEIDSENVGTLLLKHHGRLFVTSTHVDIMLSLDALPIAIRLAGFDRDPGWVPAAGRVIRFHFE